jgi:hypothetical protein
VLKDPDWAAMLAPIHEKADTLNQRIIRFAPDDFSILQIETLIHMFTLFNMLTFIRCISFSRSL